MNNIYGRFSLKMTLPEYEDDKDGELIYNTIDERLKTAENILKAAAGIEMNFEWDLME